MRGAASLLSGSCFFVFLPEQLGKILTLFTLVPIRVAVDEHDFEVVKETVSEEHRGQASAVLQLQECNQNKRSDTFGSAMHSEYTSADHNSSPV